VKFDISDTGGPLYIAHVVYDNSYHVERVQYRGGHRSNYFLCIILNFNLRKVTTYHVFKLPIYSKFTKFKFLITLNPASLGYLVKPAASNVSEDCSYDTETLLSRST